MNKPTDEFASITAEADAPAPASFDIDETAKQANARLGEVRDEIEHQQATKAKAQAKINALREEERKLLRFISAATPRTRKSSK